MNLYNELKKDHKNLKAVLKKLAAAESPDKRRKLVTKVRDLLVPHSRAEEAVLYNALRESEGASDVVAHSYQEHIQAEALLRALQVTEAISLNWQTGVEKLAADLEHHIEEEETRVFAAARSIFSDQEAEELGAIFLKLKPKMGAGIAMSNLELAANLLPAKFRKGALEKIIGSSSETQQAS